MSNKNGTCDDFYEALTDRFRGHPDTIKKRFRFYERFLVPLRKGVTVKRALDLGCGRGEWLEIISALGFDAIGVDSNSNMLVRAKSGGATVVQDDILRYMKQEPSNSYAVISSMQCIEHLPFPIVTQVIQEAYRLLVDGGLLILETVNPENTIVSTTNFYLDPTHVRPIPPALLHFVAEFHGYKRAKIVRLQEDARLRDAENPTLFDVLNGASPDYALIAQKPTENFNLSNLELEKSFAESYGLTQVVLADRYQNHLTMQIEHLTSRIEKLEKGRVWGRLGLVKQRAKELYWTVTRFLGFAHLHDGSRATRAIARSILQQPLKSESFATNLAYIRLLAAASCSKTPTASQRSLPRLAFVSPLPPEKTGIANYSAELIKSLSRRFDIDAIVNKKDSTGEIDGAAFVRDVAWFREHARDYDFIMYHVGNSKSHSHIFSLLKDFPGVVVLHDLFLGDALNAMDEQDRGKSAYFSAALYESHGYSALLDRFKKGDLLYAIQQFPASLFIFQLAQSVIVHSHCAKSLALSYYGEYAHSKCHFVPLVRKLPEHIDRNQARGDLGLSQDAFIVTCFGTISRNKCCERIVEGWAKSRLSRDPKAHLVFIGEVDPGISKSLNVIVTRCALTNVQICAYVSSRDYERWLESADMAVQLRRESRGESSASVLDCMSYGVATIINRHGSLNEIPDDCVCKISDNFADEELVQAFEELSLDHERRQQIGEAARQRVSTDHSLERSADYYCKLLAEAVGQATPLFSLSTLGEVADKLPHLSNAETIAASRNVAERSFFVPTACRQLLVDVSSLVREDLQTGIQRAVRAQLSSLLLNPEPGLRVEPVWLDIVEGQWRLRYARNFTCKLLGLDLEILEDQIVYCSAGDIYYMPDFFGQGVVKAAESGVYRDLRARGVTIAFLVYDILPVLYPQFFPPGASERHLAWLKAIAANANHLICISKTVMESVASCLRENTQFSSTPKLSYAHLGADFNPETKGFPRDFDMLLDWISSRATFVMVGTIEPRKGHLQALQAFERLWADGVDVNLLIIGGEGWLPLPDAERRTIPKIVKKLHSHPEHDRRLLWLGKVSDECLVTIYEKSTCLLACSEDEGFGLPLIEAARLKLPILARDIAVFREVAGEHAIYFQGKSGRDLALAVKEWLLLYNANLHKKSDGMPWSTWAISTQHIKKLLLDAPPLRGGVASAITDPSP